jgi:hypothetical protein
MDLDFRKGGFSLPEFTGKPLGLLTIPQLRLNCAYLACLAGAGSARSPGAQVGWAGDRTWGDATSEQSGRSDRFSGQADDLTSDHASVSPSYDAETDHEDHR